jgi:heme A synthase
MKEKVFSTLLLIVGILILLGAYGHGFKGRLGIDAELDKFPIASNVYTMLYVVWYFVSGCFVLFGVTIIWAWWRLRKRDRSLVGITYLIGVLFLVTGIGGMIYRHGDPFMSVFIAEGALVLISTFVLAGAPLNSEHL